MNGRFLRHVSTVDLASELSRRLAPPAGQPGIPEGYAVNRVLRDALDDEKAAARLASQMATRETQSVTSPPSKHENGPKHGP